MSLGDDGLIVPVVHDAHELSVEGLAARIRDLARRARARELTPDEVRGGTFTITNPGQYGSIMATPIINQPQVGDPRPRGGRQAPGRRDRRRRQRLDRDPPDDDPRPDLGSPRARRRRWRRSSWPASSASSRVGPVRRPRRDARDELWVCHLGHDRLPRGARAAGARARRAPGRTQIPDMLLLLEHSARLHARAALGARRAADGRGVVPAAGHRDRRHRPRRQGHLPRPRPARRLPDRARRRRRRVRAARSSRRSSPRSPRRASPPARAPEDGPDYTGVWVEDRKIASIGVHVAARRHHARLRRQRRERPAAVQLGRRLRPAGRADDLVSRRRGRPASCTAFASGSAFGELARCFRLAGSGS